MGLRDDILFSIDRRSQRATVRVCVEEQSQHRGVEDTQGKSAGLTPNVKEAVLGTCTPAHPFLPFSFALLLVLWVLGRLGPESGDSLELLLVRAVVRLHLGKLLLHEDVVRRAVMEMMMIRDWSAPCQSKEAHNRCQK